MRRLTSLLMLCGLLSLNLAAGPATRETSPNFTVTKIRFYPRTGHAAEMKGGSFAGSLTSATNDFRDIVPIAEAPVENQWTELTVPPANARAFRFVKYQARNGIAGDIAEIEFYAGDEKLTGMPFGTTGSKDPNNDPKLAFDGDTKTFYVGTSTFNQYVGLDLGAGSQAVQPELSVAQGTYPDAQKVTLSSATPGATIIYSIDNWGRPSINAQGKPENGKIYNGQPLVIGKSCIIQAVAYQTGLAESLTTVAAYRIGDMKADPKEHAEFHIGNSLTDTVNGWMEPLAASGGHKIRYYRFTIPGAPTDWLWDHPGTGFGEGNYAQAFLARAPLTDLITQPFHGHQRSIDNEALYSGKFFDLARKYSPDLQMWLYVQWPTDVLDKRNDWNNGFSWMNKEKVKFGEPAKTWQEAVTNHARYTELVMQEMNKARADEIKAGTCKPVLIIPGGLALSELRTRIEAGKMPGMSDFATTVFNAPGDIHMNSKGAYLISLVHYACLYKENPEGKVTAAKSGLTPEQATIFQQIAWQVAKDYKYSGLSEK